MHPADEKPHPATPAPGTADPDIAVAAARYGEQMMAGQTPRQRDIAVRIYERLKTGAEVDDVKDLIAELSRTATADQQRRDLDQQAPTDDPEQEWRWRWDSGQ